MKDDLSANHGLLCFSRNWNNPIQWSHYAAIHRGLCLGFDVPHEDLDRVRYSRKRLIVETEQQLVLEQFDLETVTRFLFTKYAHWRYEEEVRCFVTLENRDPEKNMFFANFSDRLKLAQVIVGAESTLTRPALSDALGALAPDVEVIKARLSFKSFRVLPLRNQGLWI
jgi:hypothetical protein